MGSLFSLSASNVNTLVIDDRVYNLENFTELISSMQEFTPKLKFKVSIVKWYSIGVNYTEQKVERQFGTIAPIFTREEVKALALPSLEHEILLSQFGNLSPYASKFIRSPGLIKVLLERLNACLRVDPNTYVSEKFFIREFRAGEVVTLQSYKGTLLISLSEEAHIHSEEAPDIPVINYTLTLGAGMFVTGQIPVYTRDSFTCLEVRLYESC